MHFPRGIFIRLFFAEKIGYPFIDAAELVCFNRFGGFDAMRTDKCCRQRLKEVKRAVIPGFTDRTKQGSDSSFLAEARIFQEVL